MRSEAGRINVKISLLATSSLIICVISGIPLAFHYQPTNPLLSVLTIETFVPFGNFFRNLHYLSAQLTLIFTAIHLVDSIHRQSYRIKRALSWTALILVCPLLLFITFTGYLLRADEVGEFAGTIAENMLLGVPLIGTHLQAIFLAKSQSGLLKIYTWHITLSFLLTLALFIWHVRPRLILRWESLFYFLWLFPIVLLWKFPLVPLEGEKARGPWFFIGAQQLLKLLDPSLVFFILLLPIFFLLFYVYFSRYTKILTWLLVIYFGVYGSLSIWFFLD